MTPRSSIVSAPSDCKAPPASSTTSSLSRPRSVGDPRRCSSTSWTSRSASAVVEASRGACREVISGPSRPSPTTTGTGPPRIDRPLIEAAVGLHFLGAARNVVLVAPQGLGKTMIAQNIAHQAIVQGHSVLFTTAAQMLLDLGGQESSRALESRLKHYAKQSLLVVDEVGYLAFDNRNADLLFQVVSRRYERKSLVLTTNLAFKDWPSVFPNATCATALIDRVIHHADVIGIEGKSYRLREAEDAAKKDGPKPKK